MDQQLINFKDIYFHPEEEPNTEELNSIFINANKDINYIDENIITATNNYKDLLNNTKIKINDIKALLIAEKERLQDINILCNKYTDFSSAININKDRFTGSLSISEDNIISGLIKEQNQVTFTIDKIEGNGYEGNQYVYRDNDFVINNMPTDNRKYISDNNLATAYEYSRITKTEVDNSLHDFNRDSEEAECTITLHSKDTFNHILINSERKDLILKAIYISTDGLEYTLDKEYNLAINDNFQIYEDNQYIYNSGIINITPTKYVKIVFQSNGITDETIAYIKTEVVNDKTSKKLIKVDSAHRHVIKINELSLFKNSYSSGVIETDNLLSSEVNAISLFCNEYISNDYNIENYVSYYFIINGQEYEVIPINSQRNGKKIIKNSNNIYTTDYSSYINESIKNVKLKIVIKNINNNTTPFVSNVKILLGGE